MIPRKTRVSENLAMILKSQKCLWQVSKSCFWVILNLWVSAFFKVSVLNFETWVLQSDKVSNLPCTLYPYFYIGGAQRNKSAHYTTFPLTIKISLTVQFQTQQMGFYTDMYNVPVRLLKHPAFLISLYQFQLTSSLTVQYFLQPAKCYYY